jgi:hypothetical protein
MVRPHRGSVFGRAALTKQAAHVHDIRTTPAYVERDPFVVAAVELAGYRAVLAVPMLKGNKLVGSINIYRQEVGPFTNKQIELVTNFAKQAVIAIENTRLLNELRESLQQQTATADVLRVISSSPGDLEPVFRAMLDNAIRVCDANFGTLFRYDGDVLHLAAGAGTPPALVQARRFWAERQTGGGFGGRDMRLVLLPHRQPLALLVVEKELLRGIARYFTFPLALAGGQRAMHALIA